MKLGFTDVYLNWIFQFLTQKKMRVKVNDKVSMWANVLSGVPQGSVLEPLLFLLYVNDLSDSVVKSMRLFARDNSSWSLQRDLDGLCNWSDKSLLKINTQKCKLMYIGHNMPTSYYLEMGTRTMCYKSWERNEIWACIHHPT